MAGVVANPPLPLDHVRDPAEGPQIGGVASGQRPFQEQSDQPGLMAWRQLGWATRNGLGSQPPPPIPLVGLGPAHDRTVGTPELLRDGQRAQTPLPQLDGPLATPLQLTGAARRSHASQDSAERQWCPLFMQDSIMLKKKALAVSFLSGTPALVSA